MTVYLQQERYRMIGGSRVCCVDEGTGPAVLMVHGLGGSICNWAPTIEHFKRTHRVVALDLPGFGKSVPSACGCDVPSFAGVILELLGSLGIDRAIVIGNSFGGTLALHLALEHPGLVENVVLVDAAGTNSFPELLKVAVMRLPDRWVKKALLFLVSYLVRFRFAYRVAGIYNLNEYTRPLLQEAIDTAARPDLREYMDTYLQTARTALAVRYDDRLGQIAVPVLVVWGQQDKALPLKIGQRMNRLITGSFLVAVPDAAHVPQLDRPDVFNAAVESFLSGASRGDAG